MPHRYWRARAITPYGGGALELTEFQLLADTTRVDGSATLASNIAPGTGSLANLFDDDTGTGAEWSAVTVPFLELVWDFDASPQDITDIRLAGGTSEVKFPRLVCLDYSDDATVWTLYEVFNGIAWPGVRTKSSSAIRVAAMTPSLYAEFNGADLDTTFTDSASSPHTLTAIGGAKLSTTDPIEGSASLLLNGSTDAVLVTGTMTDLYTEGQVFTLRVKVKTTAAVFQAIFGMYHASGTVVALVMEATGTVRWYAPNSQGSQFVSYTRINDGQPHEIAVVGFANGTVWLFVDGRRDSSSWVTAFGTVPSRVVIGALPNFSSQSNYWNGRIDSLAFEKNAARIVGQSYVPAQSPGIGAGKPKIVRNAGLEGTTDLHRHGVPIPSNLYTGAPSVIVLRPPASTNKNYLATTPGAAHRGRVSGTIKEDGTPDIPVRRKVRLYREIDGVLVGEQWSAASTGAYQFDNLDELQKYTILAYDHEHDYRAVVADNLTPDIV